MARPIVLVAGKDPLVSRHQPRKGVHSLVSPGDEAALSDAVVRVLRDRALRAALGYRARQIFTERFSADGLIKALRETYADLGFCA